MTKKPRPFLVRRLNFHSATDNARIRVFILGCVAKQSIETRWQVVTALEFHTFSLAELALTRYWLSLPHKPSVPVLQRWVLRYFLYEAERRGKGDPERVRCVHDTSGEAWGLTVGAHHSRYGMLDDTTSTFNFSF